MNTILRTLAGVIAAVLFKNAALHAANFTWDGGDPVSGNWSAANNWSANIAPANNGTADLFFTGTAGLNPNADLNWSIRSLAFGSGAGGFTIQGNTLTIGSGGIANNDDSVQTIENDLVLAASQMFKTTSTGSFAVNGSINIGSHTLTVDAATDFIVLGGAITGSGALTASGANSLVLTGGESNTYTGVTTVSGSLTLAKTGGAIAIPGALIIGVGAGVQHVGIGFDEQIANGSAVTVNVGGSLGLGAGVLESVGALTLGSGAVQIGTGTLKVGGVAMTGGSISSALAGRLILGGNVTATAGSLISGSIDLGGAARTFIVDGAAGSVQLEIPAAISNGSIIKTGAGTLRLSGAQTYSSLLTQAGTVDLETAVGTGSASVTVAPLTGTATINFNESQRLASLTIGNGGVVNVNAHNSSYDSQFAPPLFQNNGALADTRGVPEPGALSLLLLGACGFLLRRRVTPRA